MFYKIILYFKNNTINRNKIIGYYIFNIICSFLTTILINKIIYNLFENNFQIYMNYLIFISFLLALIYIYYIFKNKITVSDIKRNIINKIIFIFISLILTFFAFNLLNLFLESLKLKSKLLNKFSFFIFPNKSISSCNINQWSIKATTSTSSTDNDNGISSLNNIVDIKKPTVNINIPNFYVTIREVILTFVGGAAIKAGKRNARQSSSFPVKIGTSVALLALFALAAGAASLISKVDDNAGELLIKSGKILGNNYLPDLSPLFGHVDGLDKYPLNLISDLWLINYSGILFLMIILNVLIAISLKNNNIDIFNYLPKWFDPNTNKIGKIIRYMFNRYLYVWYDNRKFFLVYSWCMLMIGLLINQFGLFIILNSG